MNRYLRYNDKLSDGRKIDSSVLSAITIKALAVEALERVIVLEQKVEKLEKQAKRRSSLMSGIA